MINYESVHAVNGKLSPKKISKIPLKDRESFTKEYGVNTFTQALFHKFKDVENKCTSCGSPTKFNSYSKGYRKYCSSRCSGSHIRKSVNAKISRDAAAKHWDGIDDTDNILQGYKDGKTIKALALMFNSPQSSIRSLLVHYNVTRRSRKDYDQDEIFFNRVPKARILKDPATYKDMSFSEIQKTTGVSDNTILQGKEIDILIPGYGIADSMYTDGG